MDNNTIQQNDHGTNIIITTGKGVAIQSALQRAGIVCPTFGSNIGACKVCILEAIQQKWAQYSGNNLSKLSLLCITKLKERNQT